MIDALLSLDILDGLFPIAVFVLGAAALVVLLLRPPTRPWLRALAIAVVAGGASAVLLWLVCVRWLDLFGGSLGIATYLWTAATCMAVAVAVVSLHRTRWWRRIVASAAVVVFLVCGVVGINAAFGLNRTVGNLLNVVVPHPVRLAPPSAHGASPEVGSLWSHWRPPAGMPQTGEQGTVQIPAKASGFHARSAGIYLPPAARTSNPPRLPVVVMLMGQPGNPDPGPVGQVLDAFAQHNHGLAPIVVVADQLGPGGDDTGYLDSARFGKVYTYLTEDVPAFISSHLNVLSDHRFWTIAGYSNGGQCAISIGSKRPDLFRTIVDVSGEEFPGSTNPKQSLRDLFASDQAAYDRAKPLAILSGKQLRTTTAVFTACVDDPHYLGVARELSEASKAAGMNVTMHALPSGGHTLRALLGGLNAAFSDVYPVLDLSRPGEPARGG
ncbi:esterase family protein [Leifsonia shinshuensis]|uniref:alpha/beta hydrolase n=1 Tax=Leifsonia shinshuensis TaxID=150026 RepID=UPI001F506CED|nr:alpha/beta hydrolase-fold protein [Leifsonia shinshuensis]MCI0157652.1 esterase family protein [Leifsonia shinshuensis]